ncbi:MAG: type II secretion system protein [Candidatus Saelkia tenebricola]|nr:type II secretion system protein [Candidatus Saelkia tenebricola]
MNSMLGYQALPKKQKQQNKGFTIIEMLVAMTILSIVLGLFYSTWWMSVETTRKTHEIAQKYMGVRVFLNTLATELKSSFDLGYPVSDYPNFFYGSDPNNPEREKLEFWVTAPDEIEVVYTYPFYIHRVTYYFHKKDDKTIISKRVEAFDNSFPPIEGPVLEGNFDYKIEVETAVKPEDPQPTLPKKVTVTITLITLKSKNPVEIIKYPIRKVIPVYELKQPEYNESE